MLIQRVQIQGFKTFAQRTEFVFDPGITAVVGPNGSGKSNIVDAVRWCLGEQSFGLLRSKKTSDIIFSGSDKKTRLGMAQVSLTLDNSGGEIPIDYAQVEITRRAYRDGDNEYLVNGQKVRLQDVTELLAQTGLGKRTYAVIGQGLIDRVLSLAPEERRSLFEEAAGITGYQAKREASLRRLEATEANLTRVRDITAELGPRLAPLKRQAERAREREQWAAELRSLLREWYGFRWHAALAQVDDLAADAKILRNQLDDRQTLLDATAAEIERLRAAQAGLRAALGARHGEAGALHRAAETVGRELAVHGERRRQVAERTDDAQRDAALLAVEQETLAERLAQLQAALAEATAAHTAAAAAVHTTEAAIAAQRQAQAALQTRVEQARTTLAQAQQRQAQADAQRAQATERAQLLAQQSARHTHALAAAQAEAAAATGALHEAQAAHSACEAHAAALQADLETLASRSRTLRTELDTAEAARRHADSDLDRLQTRFDLLKRLSNEGAGLASGVRAVVQANLPGMLGPVAALLHVEPAHEKAIEVALGGALQNIVAATWDDALRAIDHLKRTQRGRATFLPLDRLHTLSAIPAPRMAGILGNAAALVGCEPAAAAARDHLLNRTWIASDLPSARRALDAHRDGARPTVVTLDGEIVRPGGAVSGGSDGERRDDSVLARAREQRELPAAIAAARAFAQTLAARCRALADEQAQSTGEVEAQQRRIAEFARDERSLRATLEDRRRHADSVAQQVHFVAQQVEAARAEAAALAARLHELAAAQGEATAAHQAAAAALAHAETAAAAAAADTILRTLADQRAAEATAAGLVQSRRALAEAQQRARASVDQRHAARLAQISTLDDETAALDTQLAALAAQEAVVRAQLDALQAAISPDETALAEVERAEAAAVARERALQHAQVQEESAAAHAQLALQRAEDAVQRLRGEIERDLGLTALETGDGMAYQPPLPLELFVEQLPVRERAPAGVEETLQLLRGRLARLVNVNPDAPREYDEAAQRYDYLTAQADDLESAAADLHRIIAELDARMQSEFTRTFHAVATHFQAEFRKLFNGGAAELLLADPANVAMSGIEIIARPPGKRPQNLVLLSGGERALTACALIFAILRVAPTPFCVLDEVDAALDEANVDRFRLAVEELSSGTQFIIVTHNRRTLEGARTIYGVTMGDEGISTVISLRLEGDTIVHHQPAGGAANGSANAQPPGDPETLAALRQTMQM